MRVTLEASPGTGSYGPNGGKRKRREGRTARGQGKFMGKPRVYRGEIAPTPPRRLTMTADTILAIDLGKYKCVACAYDRATAAADYRTIPTCRAEVERLTWTT